MSAHLRDYQAQAADSIEKQWKTHTSTLCVLPTGAGKTVLFAEMIHRRQPGRALVIAHRSELIWQAREKIERFTGLECEIEMGELMASSSLFHSQPVVIATVQTLVSGRKKKRMERFAPEHFSTIVIDEFHHAPASTYRQVLDYFLQNPKIKVLGVTATPDRADESALGQVCQSVAFDYQMVDAIEDGWLVPIEQQMVTIDGLDFSAIKTTAGDLNGGELAAIMEAEKNLHGLCSATLSIIGNRQTIVFTASVKHAEMACAIFNRHKEGIADWVCGKTDKEVRRKIMASVVSGKLQILCNVGVATEGFDAPGVEVIVMGRPTKSRALYAQMAGRATRPFPGVVDLHALPSLRREAIAASPKATCLLVDFCGNAGRHKLMTGADLLGGKYADEVKELAIEIMEKEGRRRRLSEALEEAQEEVIRKEREEADLKRKLEEARKAKLVANAKYVTQVINPFDAYDIQPDSNQDKSRGGTLTEKQRNVLVKAGIDPDSMSVGNAKRMVDEQIRRYTHNLCSLKQAALLKKHGATGDITRTEASFYIDAIAKNGWKWPSDIPKPTAPQPVAAVQQSWDSAEGEF